MPSGFFRSSNRVGDAGLFILHRLERKGFVAARWEAAGKESYARVLVLSLHGCRKKAEWKPLITAIARVMWPAEDCPWRPI
jgi:hypothetical protein